MSKCPICKKETVTRYRPFCSKRCADVDLGKWVIGGYTIPLSESAEANPDADRATRDDA